VKALLALSIALFLSACSNDAGGMEACDPLAAHAAPIALDNVLGVGKDALGTYYVVDEHDGEQRVFVSNGDAIERQRIAGSGSVDDGQGTLDIFDVSDHDPVFTLELLRSGDSTRMAVRVGEIGTKGFTIGEEGEELTVVPASEIEGKQVRNLAGDVVVEYAAGLADGRALVVTRPVDDWTYDDFRVFFGPRNAMAERAVRNVSRARDGGSTTIDFVIDNAAATASFPVELDDATMTFKPGRATLEIEGRSELLIRLEEPPADAAYSCLK
jgi:hypothetical protein